MMDEPEQPPSPKKPRVPLTQISLSAGEQATLQRIREAPFTPLGQERKEATANLFVSRLMNGGTAAQLLLEKLAEHGVIDRAFIGLMNQGDGTIRTPEGRDIPDSLIYGITRRDMEALGIAVSVPEVSPRKGKSRR